ncbi:uncharacterized protein BDW47DRAFT_20032 [Aspergillus candidus]|uniref:Transmembrane protein n=1 Tax=Aspergillus candidus TaxID=41067 RepID=A0A2I2FDU0_ASPCN|nr:hypothetical protein BDW47DRAFT_20032 [Aspergillus candidus]PLB38793.1 hypothetical protein BDW47DRAFT_20032 [Aspergillus candidus]
MVVHSIRHCSPWVPRLVSSAFAALSCVSRFVHGVCHLECLRVYLRRRVFARSAWCFSHCHLCFLRWPEWYLYLYLILGFVYFLCAFGVGIPGLGYLLGYMVFAPRLDDSVLLVD